MGQASSNITRPSGRRPLVDPWRARELKGLTGQKVVQPVEKLVLPPFGETHTSVGVRPGSSISNGTLLACSIALASTAFASHDPGFMIGPHRGGVIVVQATVAMALGGLASTCPSRRLGVRRCHPFIHMLSLIHI